MEESIFNLIPKEYIAPEKAPIYKSKYPKDTRPTGSTFTNHTTSRPGVANLNGDYTQCLGPHTHKGETSTFGKPKQHSETKDYLKKSQGVQLLTAHQSQFQEQSQQQKSQRDQMEKKQQIPKEKPIMGLKSNKNFIIANAVQNILAAPKQEQEVENYLNKKNYGQVPQYLKNINNNVQNEYNIIRELQEQETNMKINQKYQLTEQERIELKEGLTKKWEAIMKEYQSITHIKAVDTTGLKRKKMDCEKELKQIESDIAKLNRAVIFVDATS